MRGRKASAATAVDRAPGSATAKERAQVIFDQLTGKSTVAQACSRLGVGEARFHQLKDEMVRGSVAALEPRPAGRPARVVTAEQAHLAALERERQAMQLQRDLAQTRAEIALVLPRVLQPPEPAATATPEKKTRRRPARRRRPHRARP
jgi:hypothetical protein